MLTDTAQLESFLALPELEVTAFGPAGAEGMHVYCRKNTDFEVCPPCGQKTTTIKVVPKTRLASSIELLAVSKRCVAHSIRMR